MTTSDNTASADRFSFTRQTTVFVAILAAFELAALLVFPLIAVAFGALAMLLLVIVWAKAGMRTRKWLWWNPASVPLTQAEGAIAIAAALLVSVAVFLTGYEAIRFASGERDMLTGFAFRHMVSRDPSSRPVSTRSTSYSDPAGQKRLKDGLDKAGIPYVLEFEDGKEFIKWSQEHDAAVEQIRRTRVDNLFSGGRNASFPDLALREAFTDWLKQRGIPYEIVQSSEREFVVWEEGPEDLVRQFMESRSEDCPQGAGARASAKAGDSRC